MNISGALSSLFSITLLCTYIHDIPYFNIGCGIVCKKHLNIDKIVPVIFVNFYTDMLIK